MVRLKVTKKSNTFAGIIYFNSTMVRLKAEYIGYKNKRFSKFQFHYGTIKREKSVDFKSFFIKNYQRKVVCL